MGVMGYQITDSGDEFNIDDALRDEHWLLVMGSKLMADWILSTDRYYDEMSDATFRLALAMRLYGRHGLQMLALRRKP